MLTAYALLSCATPAKDDNFPKPTSQQLAWQQAELGVVFHYDLHVFDEKHYNQGENRRHAIEDVDIFNPRQLDTDQWVKVAKDMGARFAILTASHETGFRLWQSDANPYCLKAAKWGDGKRDIVAEFIASCKKHGIKPGIYLGTRWNSHLGIRDFMITERSPITQAEYNTMIEEEVAEICSRYGPLFELWFDGGAHGPKQGGPDVLGVFEKYQKDCLFYHNLERADARWGGSETGTVPYPCWATFPYPSTGAGESARQEIHKNGFALLKHGDPDGKYWMPAMSDAPLRNHEWFWDEGDENKLYSLHALMNMYYKSVGHNSTLIIGLTPDNRGLIPDPDAQRCKEWGDAIRSVFNNCLGHSSGHDKAITLDLGAPTKFDHIVLQEDIRAGERVRAYIVEARLCDKWSKLAEGTCIGHKRIHHFDAPVTAEKVRLRIEKSIAKPEISKLAAYLAEDTTDSTERASESADRRAAHEE
jgi:alpha-L-fucosidase